MPSYCRAPELKGTPRQKGFYGSSGLSFLLSFHQELHLAQSGALLSGDDSLFMGTSGEDLMQAEGRHMSFLHKSGSFHCEGTGSCSDKLLFGAWALSVNSVRNPMFRFFALLVIGLLGYLQEKQSLTAPELREPGFQ